MKRLIEIITNKRYVWLRRTNNEVKCRLAKIGPFGDAQCYWYDGIKSGCITLLLQGKTKVDKCYLEPVEWKFYTKAELSGPWLKWLEDRLAQEGPQ